MIMTEEVWQHINVDDALLDKAVLQRQGIMYKMLSEDRAALDAIHEHVEQAFTTPSCSVFFISDPGYSSTSQCYFFSFALKER